MTNTLPFEITAESIGYHAYFEEVRPEQIWASKSRELRRLYPDTFDGKAGLDAVRRGYAIGEQDQATCNKYGLDGYSEYL